MIYVIRIDIITKRVSYLCTLHKQATQCCLVFLTKAVCDRISIDLSSIIYVTIEFSQLPFLKYLSNESLSPVGRGSSSSLTTCVESSVSKICVMSISVVHGDLMWSKN